MTGGGGLEVVIIIGRIGTLDGSYEPGHLMVRTSSATRSQGAFESFL
jgi:hypothetical protein